MFPDLTTTEFEVGAFIHWRDFATADTLNPLPSTAITD
jgi:hypothetical protein